MDEEDPIIRVGEEHEEFILRLDWGTRAAQNCWKLMEFMFLFCRKM